MHTTSIYKNNNFSIKMLFTQSTNHSTLTLTAHINSALYPTICRISSNDTAMLNAHHLKMYMHKPLSSQCPNPNPKHPHQEHYTRQFAPILSPCTDPIALALNTLYSEPAPSLVLTAIPERWNASNDRNPSSIRVTEIMGKVFMALYLWIRVRVAVRDRVRVRKRNYPKTMKIVRSRYVYLYIDTYIFVLQS